MSNKEKGPLVKIRKLLIPLCYSLILDMTLFKDIKSNNCIAVTKDDECPYAKRRQYTPKFECRKDTLMKISSPELT